MGWMLGAVLQTKYDRKYKVRSKVLQGACQPSENLHFYEAVQPFKRSRTRTPLVEEGVIVVAFSPVSVSAIKP